MSSSSARSLPAIVTVLVMASGCTPASPARLPITPEGTCATGDCPAQAPSAAPSCPAEMVLVADRVCVDRYEVTMVDVRTNVEFSPYYPPTLGELRRALQGQTWHLAAVGKETLHPAVPRVPEWQRSGEARPRAVSKAGVTPQGYVSKVTALAACEASGKRLCTHEEWSTACRGDQNTPFPYGSTYQVGACNVRVRHHPAAILYGDASIGHWDPRLNQVQVEGSRLLRPTGATPSCRSAWGTDGIYDMVGNLDEWVQDGKSTFAGGFYARDTVRGCDARVGQHGQSYFDYSTGVRCCADLQR